MTSIPRERHRRYSHRVDLRIDTPLLNWLQGEARRKGVPVAELVRSFLYDRMSGDQAVKSLSMIRQVLADVIVPHVERLAGLSAKTFLEAGIAKWLLFAYLEDAAPRRKSGEPPAFTKMEEMYQRARIMAVEDLKTRAKPESDEPAKGGESGGQIRIDDHAQDNAPPSGGSG